jgi:hypothetical protein
MAVGEQASESASSDGHGVERSIGVQGLARAGSEGRLGHEVARRRSCTG